MPEEDKPEVLDKKDILRERKVIHRSDGPTPKYYTNNTELAMTSFDLSIRFGQVEEADADAIYVRDQAIISMSLHHAKAMVKVLAAYVKQFEHQHGELFVPSVEEPEIPHESVKVKVDSST
jgi:hypothetical protein